MPSLSRYPPLLPVTAPEAVVTLGEGMTPVVGLPTYGARIGARKSSP
jgi:threonine synthase